MMKEECARRARTASSVRANLLFRLTKQGFHPWWRKSIRPHLAVAGYLEQATLGASSFEGIGILAQPFLNSRPTSSPAGVDLGNDAVTSISSTRRLSSSVSFLLSQVPSVE